MMFGWFQFGWGVQAPAAPSGVEAANGNVYQASRGAVEPKFSSGSGNEMQCWRGAVEPGA